jgi:hypothetical protein
VLSLTPRTSNLRCAFCHDDLAPPLWSCERCATLVHGDCHEEAPACPTLGCARRFALSIRPHVPGASVDQLIAWITVFLLDELVLAGVAPRILKIFEKRRTSLPFSTRTLLSLGHFADGWLGYLTAIAVLVATIHVFLRYRERRITRRAFTLLILAGLAFLPFAFVGVFFPLVNTRFV